MRVLHSVLLAALIGSIIGCGPTKTGLENRAAAYDRMNGVNSRIMYDQARQAYEAGQFDTALENINAAIERYDHDPAYHLLAGRIYVETHRLERAQGAFARAIELDPTYAEAHYFAGIVHQRWSQNQQAYEAYRTAAEHDSENAQFVLAAAESLIAIDDVAGARRLIQSKLRHFENNAAMHHLLAQIARLESNPRAAARLLAEARLLRPDDASLLEELAWTQFDAGQYGECFSTLNQLNLQDTRPDLNLMRARCLAYMDRTIEARNAYLQLSRTRPDNVDVWIELGGVSWELGDFRRVALSGVRAMALAPERYEGYMLKGIHAQENGNIQDAVQLFRQAAARAAHSAEPHILLGKALQSAGNNDAALVAYEKAVLVDPSSRAADAVYRSFLDQHSHRVSAGATE